MSASARHRRGLSILMVLATVMALVIAPVIASAAPKPTVLGGSIVGTITDQYGEPIEFTGGDEGVPIAIEVYQWDGSAWQYLPADEWGNPYFQMAAGEYRIENLAPGAYRMRFYDWYGTGLRDEFYNNAYTIDAADDVVVVSAGETTADISLGPVEWGSLAGMITDAVTHAPTYDVSVLLYEPDPISGEWWWEWGSGSMSLGDWQAQVPVGEYKVEFSDWYGRYISQWYGGTDMDSADLVTVAPLHTTSGIDAAMVKAGHITGTITGPGGVPLEGIRPNLHYTDGNEANDTADQLLSDENGHYDVGGLRPGTYRLVFTDYNGAYTQEAYNNISAPGMWSWQAATLPGAADIVVGAGATVSGINAELAAAGRITGTVTDPSGPVEWACVEVYDLADETTPLDTAFTKEDGTYVLGNLATGDYKLKFYYDQGYGADWYYSPNFYSNKTSWATAGFVHVTTGGTIAGANASLVPSANWGTVAGTVTDSVSGVALDGMDVYLSVNDGSGWVEMNWTQTDEDGYYSFKYVPVGSVKVEVRDPWLLDYGQMYATNSMTFLLGGPGLYPTNFSMVRATVDEGGSSIESGIVSGYAIKGDAPGTYIPYAPVEFYQYDDFSGEYWYGGMNTADASGKYVAILPVGTYKIKAGPTVDYAPRFYPAADTITAASTVNVTNGGSFPGRNITLPRGNKITGTVLDQNGDPVEGAYVSALVYNADWDVWEPVTWDGSTNAYTDASGNYSLGGLLAGTYKIAFYGWDNNLGSKWWKSTGEAQSPDQASTITFAGAGATQSGINAVLSPAADIRGTVTDQDANRVSGVKVKLWWNSSGSDWALIQSTYAYHDGDFLLGQFSAGTYKLEFVHDTGLYDTNWFKNAATEAAATPVVLNHGESRVVTQTVQSNDTTYSPVFGASRIETAIKASEAAFPDGATTVVIATGYNWPDALGGAALAGAYQGPILLTDPTYLPWQVMDEVVRLGATDAIILGGTGAVKSPVETALKSELGQAHVRRLAGDNRYETAVMVAEDTVNRLGAAYDGTAFVATGENFPDALGASPLAAAASWPIYLTPGDSLNPLTAAAMEDHGVTDALILGEIGAISAGVSSAIDAVPGVASVVRLGGSSRYETAVEVAQYGVDNVFGLGWNGVAIATGQNYPDALAGGVLQGLSGSVMLLTPSASLDPAVQAKLTAKKAVITEVRYLGGTNAVTMPVRTAIANLLN